MWARTHLDGMQPDQHETVSDWPSRMLAGMHTISNQGGPTSTRHQAPGEGRVDRQHEAERTHLDGTQPHQPVGTELDLSGDRQGTHLDGTQPLQHLGKGGPLRGALSPAVGDEAAQRRRPGLWQGLPETLGDPLGVLVHGLEIPCARQEDLSPGAAELRVAAIAAASALDKSGSGRRKSWPCSCSSA